MKRTARNLAMLIGLGALGSVYDAKATPIQSDQVAFSSLSSDQTPAGILDARALFQYDRDLSQLTVTPYNDTNTNEDYRITSLNFTANSDILGLTLLSAPAGYTGVSLSLNDNTPFGAFRFLLDTGRMGTGPTGIPEGQSASYVFQVVGPNADVYDFTGAHSTNPPGQFNGVAVAKFQGDRDSAYGLSCNPEVPNPIPEPGTMSMLGAGGALLGLGYLRRKKQ